MKTVIFDLDGTLVETHEGIVASVNHVREKLFGLPPLEADRLKEIINVPGLNLARELYGVEAYTKEAAKLFESHYLSECVRRSKLFEGVEDMLRSLKESGCDLFVATNAPTSSSLRILEKHNIKHHFTDIVGADRVDRPKPHPQAIHMIAKIAGHEEIWMVGDSMKDILAAKKAGVRPLFVEWGYTRDLPAEHRDVPKASKVEQLPALILG